MPRSVSLGHKAPKAKPDVQQLRVMLNLAPRWKESLLSLSVLHFPHSTVSSWHTSGGGIENTKGWGSCCILTTMGRTGRYGLSNAFPGNRPTKQWGTMASAGLKPVCSALHLILLLDGDERHRKGDKAALFLTTALESQALQQARSCTWAFRRGIWAPCKEAVEHMFLDRKY